MFNQFVAHEHLVTDPSCVLRYTNFVEIMCPFFHVRHVGCPNCRRLFRVVWPSAWIKLWYVPPPLLTAVRPGSAVGLH